MSEYGDFCREQRESRRRNKSRHSQLCSMCGTTVWDTERECRYCGNPNYSYDPRRAAQIDQKEVQRLLGNNKEE